MKWASVAGLITFATGWCTAAEKPNLLLFLADDMTWTDVGVPAVTSYNIHDFLGKETLPITPPTRPALNSGLLLYGRSGFCLDAVPPPPPHNLWYYQVRGVNCIGAIGP